MQHARKMVLVPHDVAQQVHTSHRSTMAPTYEGLDGLDEQMQSIIRRRDIPLDERVKLYQQALLGYVDMHQKLKQPMAVKVETVSTEADGVSGVVTDGGRVQHTEPTSWVQRVAESVPKSLKKKAEQLVKLIENAPSHVLRFNETGELIVGNQKIEGTHIVDLINDMLRKRKSFNPRGWETFGRALASLYPPQELIGNEDRWRFIQRGVQLSDSNTYQRGLLDESTRVKTDDGDDGSLYARASHLSSAKKTLKKKSRKSLPTWVPY